MSEGSRNNSSNNNNKNTETSQSKPSSMMDEARESLKSTINSGVKATNRFLASLQKTTETVRQPVVKGITFVEQEGTALAKKVHQLHERRHEFGPHLVVGSGLVAAGLVGLRRGRLGGALAGVATGGAVYVAIYEDIPYILFGRRFE